MNPAKYASNDEYQKCHVREAINLFGEELKNKCGKCMDIGCGPGDITKDILLPSLNPEAVIIGTDISMTMIEYAKKTYGDNERLVFEVLDIETESLPKKYISKFDHIFSFHTLQWCNDIGKAFENIYRMLQPGGTILVYFIASNAVLESFKEITQDARFASYVQKKFIFPFSDSARPTEELKVLLESIGFNIKHCDLLAKDFVNIDKDAFLSSIMSIFTFLDAMPLSRKEEFKDKFVRGFNNKIKPCKAELTDAHNKLLIAYAQKDK